MLQIHKVDGAMTSKCIIFLPPHENDLFDPKGCTAPQQRPNVMFFCDIVDDDVAVRSMYLRTTLPLSAFNRSSRSVDYAGGTCLLDNLVFLPPAFRFGHEVWDALHVRGESQSANKLYCVFNTQNGNAHSRRELQVQQV